MAADRNDHLQTIPDFRDLQRRFPRLKVGEGFDELLAFIHDDLHVDSPSWTLRQDGQSYAESRNANQARRNLIAGAQALACAPAGSHRDTALL